MMVVSTVVAFLALLAHVAANAFDKTCEFKGSKGTWWGVPLHVKYSCQDGHGGWKCVELDLNNCLGAVQGSLVFVGEWPGLENEIFRYKGFPDCAECEFDEETTHPECSCSPDSDPSYRSEVWLGDQISNWWGELHGPPRAMKCFSVPAEGC